MRECYLVAGSAGGGASFPSLKLPVTKKSPLHIHSPLIRVHRKRIAKVKGAVLPSVGYTWKSAQSHPASPLTKVYIESTFTLLVLTTSWYSGSICSLPM